jgi:gliding motility-associated-like protein
MVNLEFTTGAVQNATYNWSGPNGFSSTDQNPIIIDATVADSGLYSCVITVNGCNSLSGSSYAYMIPTPPTPNIVANDPICEEGDLILSTDSFPNAIYLWSGPNGFSAATMDVTIPFVTAAASGQYLLVKQANGCSSPQGAANIVVNPKPHADFNPNPATTTIMDPQVWFINTSDLQMVYDWSFGDNTVSSDFEPFHSYADTGSYQVILMVTNPATSCSSSVEKTYIIEPYFSFFIPNAFTPNGDGLNDEFKIVTNSILAYQIHVYDRWGQIIWQSVQPDQTWNGKIGGQDAPQGSYVYHVKVTTNTGEQKKFTGTVDILR